MDFDLWYLIVHDCDVVHCCYDSDSSIQKPLNTIEYNGLYITINMFSKGFCPIFYLHHKKNISETVPNSVHLAECTIPVLNMYIYIYLHFKYKIVISHNPYHNILIYKSSRINYVAMIIYGLCPDLKYCYLENIDTEYWKPDNQQRCQTLPPT